KVVPSGEIVRHFRNGQELLAAGRHKEAIAELEAVTGMAPDSIGGRHELALAYDAAGRHADALREMRLTLRLTMTDQTAGRPTRYGEESDLRYELATLMAKNGEFGEAVAELTKAARLAPALERRPEYHISLGIAQAGRGRRESATQELARAMEMSPALTTKALASWVTQRPDGPETPLLERILAEGSTPEPAGSEAPSEASTPPRQPT
ncbi:MAG: tetratricopeptide repeat protein, partial [Armatimonadota bacterium]